MVPVPQRSVNVGRLRNRQFFLAGERAHSRKIGISDCLSRLPKFREQAFKLSCRRKPGHEHVKKSENPHSRTDSSNHLLQLAVFPDNALDRL